MKFRLLILLIILVTLVPTLHAQTPTPPILLLDGDLVQVQSDGGLTPLTADGNIEGAVLSPDGAYLAYVSLSPISVDALARVGPIGGGALPADIWIVPTQEAEPFLVAAQPADGSFFTENVPDNALLRSLPTWSPNATQLAWTEEHYPSFAPEARRIMIYDMTSGTTNALVANLPESAGVPSPLDIRWGAGGLAVLSFRFDEADASMDPLIQVYDATSGALVSEALLPDDPENIFTDFAWVTMPDGGQQVGVLFANNNWDLINPQTGEHTDAVGQVERYSLANPSAAHGLTLARNEGAGAETPPWTWTMTTPDGTSSASNAAVSPNTVALGPTGQSLVLLTAEGGVSIWDVTGGFSDLAAAGTVPAGMTTVFWGPEGWRLRPDTTGQPITPTPAADTTATLAAATAAATQQAPMVVCAPTLLTQLEIGDIGRVLPGLPNTIRSLPNRGEDSLVLGEIPAGDTFVVQDGPECDAEGHNWWLVNYNGVVGWTAENDPTEYWVEPVQ